MADYDAIVIGAGHNGLAAAVILQRAGLRTVCLEAKRYAGGMASTVELFDGYRFEIAGSVQFPTAATVSRELGLDTLPTVDAEVMSVALRGVGDDPVVQYTDPIKLLAHLGDVHGADAVNGMAGCWRGVRRRRGHWAGSRPARRRRLTTRCSPAPVANSNVQLSTTCCSARSPTCSTGICRTGKSTVRCAARSLCWRSTPSTGAGHAGQRGGAGVRARCARRRQRADEKAARRHRSAHVAPAEQFETHGGELRLRTKATQIVADDGRVRGVRIEAGTP
ncbi:FAD binding domain protein [Mycobacterium xenopi 4042]|uniref:FAD binding domain protein n=1 Tax=Mycobacterium xenopi 4042 TaxID=1299334 RepID=X8CN01_MYCXE|nr:FAD binding domain protein [Mycobacterium xenopi 4042]